MTTNEDFLKPWAIAFMAINFIIASLAAAESTSNVAVMSIQDIIDNAGQGDVVEIMSGTYPENIVIRMPITLRGIDTGNGAPLIGEGKGGCAISAVPGVRIEGIKLNGEICKVANVTDLPKDEENGSKGSEEQPTQDNTPVVKDEKSTQTAPQLEFKSYFGGAAEDYGRFMERTSDGGYIISGSTNSFGAGDYDLWLVKTDMAGKEEWNRTFGGEGEDYGWCVREIRDGGYIVTGYTDSFGAGNFDLWLLKVDSKGNELWNTTFGGSLDDYGYSVSATDDGGYIVTGSTRSFGTGGGLDLWFIKTDKDGALQWSNTIGIFGDDYGLDVLQTDDGGYIIAGSTYGKSSGDGDAWLIKIDASGKTKWSKKFGGTGFDVCYSVQQTKDGGYIGAGYNKTGTSNGTDGWIFKADGSGNQQWSRTYGGADDDLLYSIMETSDGGYVAAGQEKSFGAGEEDVWLLKIDAKGNESWSTSYGGPATDCGYSIVRGGEGEYAIAGLTKSYGSGESDLLLIQTSSQGSSVIELSERSPSVPSTPEIGLIGVPSEFCAYYIHPEGKPVMFTFDWGDGTEMTRTGMVPSGELANASHAWDREGSFLIRVKAEDGERDSGWSSRMVTIVRPNSRPDSAMIPSGPAHAIRGSEVSFMSSASDKDGDRVKLAFDWGDGSTSETSFAEEGSAINATHRYASDGLFIVRAMATDERGEAGEWSGGRIISIETITPPSTPSVPAGTVKGRIGTNYAFSTSATDPDGGMISYSFDWGDGSSFTQTKELVSGARASASHKWQSNGTFTVRAKAKNSRGSESDWSEGKKVIIV